MACTVTCRLVKNVRIRRTERVTVRSTMQECRVLVGVQVQDRKDLGWQPHLMVSDDGFCITGAELSSYAVIH